MSNEKARFLFHIYFHYKNKKKHVGDKEFSDNDSFYLRFFAAPLRALREDFLKKCNINI
jgi:hypothetical protein